MTRLWLALLLTIAGCSAASHTADSGTTGLPDGALVYAGQLPACNLPASLNGASRTFLACAGCFASTGGSCSIGVADNATDCQSCGPCVMACRPDQYAVLTGDESLDPDEDAGAVTPTLPAGCGGALPVMENFLDNYETSGGTWTVTCCPCQ